MQSFVYSICLSACVFSSTLSLFAETQEGDVVRRIQSHLILRDYSEAKKESDRALLLYPNSMLLHEMHIQALSHAGDQKKMLISWSDYVSRFPEQSLNRNTIEQMAWGVLDKASRSSCVITRTISVLAALFSQDAKGVVILHHHMRDSCSSVRALAVKLAGHMRDQKLIDEIKRLYRVEKVWLVRREILESIGNMKIKEMQLPLKELISNDRLPAEERAVAIQSLVNLFDHIERIELENMVNSDRAGMRLLACHVVTHLQLRQHADLLLILLKDYHPDVRIAALQSLGLLRPLPQDYHVAEKCCDDINPKVAVTAAWLRILENPEKGLPIMEKHLSDRRQEQRLLAAAALGATGRYGSNLAMIHLKENSDPYVRLNLALGLIGQRKNVERCGEALHRCLAMEKDRWSWQSEGVFRILSPKPNKINSSLEATPELENQIARLEILNTLALIRDPYAQDSIKKFLTERAWGISATASALLVTEGDDTALELVKQLLYESNSKLRIQAALLLSLWSRNEEAIETLHQGYAGSDREMKGRILEGLGRIGSMQSVPFLITLLQEPSTTLRVIAAMALIQCLNH